VYRLWNGTNFCNITDKATVVSLLDQKVDYTMTFVIQGAYLRLKKW